MADFLTKQQRSALMSSIRGRHNRTTEIVFVSMLRRTGLKGWRRHYPVAGRPDFAFPKARVAVFIDGCFWHGCRWHSRMPTSNTPFWQKKFAANKSRDRMVVATLRAKGWRAIRIWEHQLKDPVRVIARVQALLEPPPLSSARSAAGGQRKISRRRRSTSSASPPTAARSRV